MMQFLLRIHGELHLQIFLYIYAELPALTRSSGESLFF
jgi:hypothetical protein